MRVLTAIDAIARHNVGEDDLVEFKSTWPAAEKEKFVRQLAGSLNRAAGEPVILVIGIDEKTGRYNPWAAPEISNWWPSVQRHFDQVAPELIRDRTIQVNGGHAIRALAIASDRAPFVLKTANGSSSREIPIREGTRTKSASRDEILRMFVPAVDIPKVDVLRAAVTLVEDYGGPNPESDDGGVFFGGYLDLFLEHTSNRTSVMFPRHRIRGELFPTETAVRITSPAWGIPELKGGSGHESVVERPDGFVVSGPGTMRVRFRSDFIDWDSNKGVLASDVLQMSIALPVSGTNRAVQVEQNLSRDDGAIQYSGGSSETIAHWSYAF